jgi:hypothetical protein
MKADKVWIVSAQESLFYGRMYRRLIEEVGDSISGVILLPPVAGVSLASFIKEIKYRLGFWGLKAFLYASLRFIGATITGSGDIKRAAHKQNIVVHDCLNLEGASKILQKNKADKVLTTVPFRVTAAVLAKVPGGWINTHCSPLPRYAGVDAPFWCLYHGEKELAVTLHYMNEEFDKGPIIRQQFVAYTGQSYFEIVEQLFDCAFDMHRQSLLETLPTKESLPAQNSENYSFYGKPKAAHGREFRQQGGRFV